MKASEILTATRLALYGRKKYQNKNIKNKET